jgi:hypothetical protein
MMGRGYLQCPSRSTVRKAYELEVRNVLLSGMQVALGPLKAETVGNSVHSKRFGV